MGVLRRLSIWQLLYSVATLASVVAVLAVADSLGYDVGSVFAIALIALIVTTTSTLLAYAVHWYRNRRPYGPRTGQEIVAELEYYRQFLEDRPAYHLGSGMAWLAGTVLLAERALHIGVPGWLAVGLWPLANFGALVYVGARLLRARLTRDSLRAREAAAREHRAHLADRRQLAERSGMAYEERSIELAERFGRLDQPVPDDFVDAENRLTPIREALREGLATVHTQVLLTHAAALQAESVVRTRVGDLPVAAFDLELIDQDLLANLEQFGHVSEPVVRAELTKRYLTVWLVRLPIALPFVSSAFAIELERGVGTGTRWESYHRVGPAATPTNPAKLGWHEGPERQVYYAGTVASAEEVRRQRIDLTAEDEQFGSYLMSVPAVRQAALSPEHPPYYVDGNALVTSDYSAGGVSAAEVHSRMLWLAELAHAFPWSELARYRADPAVDRSPAGRAFFLTYRHGAPPTERVLERWQLGTTRSGPRCFRRSHVLTWRDQYEEAGQLATGALYR
jgi:NADH:ubiquinone oxidoreductase subunit K